MTRCTDFWKKWRKEPNFCGLSETTVDEIEKYLSTVDKICTLGLKEDTVYENFPEGAARPLIRMEEGDPRTNVLNFVVKSLKQGDKLTGKMIQTTIKRFLPDEDTKKDDAKVPQLRKPKEPLPVEPAPKKEPILLHPELKASPYQPGTKSIPVTDAPLQPSLGERMKEPEACTSPPAPVKPLPGDWINKPSKDPEAIKQAARVELETAAERLLELMPKSTQLAVTDQLRDHPSWKVKDVFYYGVEALAEKRVKK